VSHYEISPRERDDEAERDERDFGVQEFADEALDDKIRRQGDGGPFEDD
jgi:hypothetical protein